MEELRKDTNEEINGGRWHFWFLVSFSLFLIVTFVYYLPLRFLYHATAHGEEMTHEEGVEPMMHGGGDHGGAAYHEEGDVKDGLAVNLNVSPVPISTGTTTRLDFFVNTKPGNVPVQIDQLQIEHEKYMHVIGVRDDMNEFFHIHPQESLVTGVMTTGYIFNNPGRYKIWSEVKKDGTDHTFGHPEIVVGGDGVKSNKEITFARNVIVGNYQVLLKMDEPIAKGYANDLSFDIHTLTSGEVNVENYLGAKMHLTVIKDDWKQFIHTHPEGDPMMMDQHGATKLISEAYAHGGVDDEAPVSSVEDEKINFHVTFPEAGLYKVFAQFRPRGIDLSQDEALTASFWIKVEEKAPLGISTWWVLLIVSLILIVILSIGVRKFMTVKVIPS